MLTLPDGTVPAGREAPEVDYVDAGVSARVQGGTIVPDEGVELAEGSRVTVIIGEPDAPFALSAADEAKLTDAIAEADRGEVLSADELLRRLSR